MRISEPFLPKVGMLNKSPFPAFRCYLFIENGWLKLLFFSFFLFFLLRGAVVAVRAQALALILITIPFVYFCFCCLCF